ncbi:MAG: outer membrane lipoprotein chaperone LolA [Moraxellaceae bacterium]|nr:MAG: outer membrane lipoprotein chaperone LolA [Moraxellaceae bacterium]
MLLTLSAAITHAADDQAASQLRKQLDAMNTLQGNFTQTLVDKEGKKQDESKGTFMMQRPGKFYWKTESPAPQLLVSNQKKIWLYDPDLETVNERLFSDDLQKTPALLLSEDVEKLRKNFSISRTQLTPKSEKYTLTPKVTDGLFQELILVFLNDQLAEFHIKDSLGQISNFILANVKRNQPVAEDLFNFVPPANADVIKNQ